YAHNPLKSADEIRLLELLPSGKDSDLVGELLHVRLGDRPRHEAVSYTWGDKFGVVEYSGTLVIRSCGRALKITCNCDAALRRLRDIQHPRLVWVGSVYNNQEEFLGHSK
ncbi:hypothetical protein P154DRAFT_443988, partial [Amniculicola lignicola CBS 123094]